MDIYDRLLQFTLFQGMSHAELMQVAGHTKMDFSKLAAGKRLIREGDPCTQLIFLTAGTLQAESHSDDHSWHVVEQVGAPYILQPTQLFGITQRYTTTFRTLTPCSLITLDKLNTLATEAQRLRHTNWRQAPDNLRQHITRFFFAHCLYPAGQKTFHLLMTQLAQELNDSRINISQALNQMQDDGLITLHRGRIHIPMLERLLM